MAFAEINDAKLVYEIAREGPPLVMLHAGICDSRMWDDQFAAFAKDYRVVRYDLRGYGQSHPVAGQFAHHEDLRALLDVLKIERACLMGCSLGGMTALDFTLTYPNRVSGLVLVGSGLDGFESEEEAAEPPEWAEAVKAYEAGDYERASEFEVRLWVDGPRRQPHEVPAAIRDKVRLMNTIALKNEASNLGKRQKLDPPAAKRLTELHVPMLVIVGDYDQPEIAAIADLLAEKVPGAQKVIMTGTAHVPNMEQPALFNQHVLDWLNLLKPF